MDSLKISDIKDGTTFQKQIYLDNSFLLLDRNMPFSAQMKKSIIEWGFKEVFIDDNSEKREIEKPKKVIQENFETVNIDDVMNEEVNNVDSKKDKLTLTNINVINEIRSASEKIAEIQESDIEAKMIFAYKVYDAFKEYITQVYTRFVTHRELKIGLISEAVQELCKFISNNKKYILRIQPTFESKSDKNFIVNHSLRSTIFALTIGLNLKMQNTKLVELGVAAILHEIGQIRLPPQLYITDRKLLPMERALLSTHAAIGFNILKENNFPLTIQLGVLEHHERENGQGYPRKLVGDKISLYGKILSVVCSYEAISAPRLHKEAKSTHEAMIEMLRNSDKQYDDLIIKALVQSVSIFPIGGYVFLANGKVAQVTDTNGNDPRNPIVQILGEKNQFGFPLTIQTDNDKFKIVRVLNKSETTDLLTALKNKK